MNKIARVLVADAGMPSAGFGSWSQRMEYLLQQFPGNRFDYLVSEYVDAAFNSAHTQRFNCKQQKSRIVNKLMPGARYKEYLKAIDTILGKHPQAIICIIDTLRVKKAIWTHVREKKLEHRVRLVYYQCGFSKYLSPADYNNFTEGVSECIYLTRNGYRFDLLHNPSMPFPVNVLHNPVNHQVFYPPTPAEKAQLRSELGMDNRTQFIWASHDRPKKGLEVILAAWLKFYTPEKNIALHVVGVQRDASYPGVYFHGKVHNSEMPRWFKAADIGVFSSLWPEGFSLSLAEQVSSGLFCIASTAGCVAEYFKPGTHGIAIGDPNLVDVWVNAFEDSLVQLPNFEPAHAVEKASLPFLTFDEWCMRFQAIFDNIEQRMLL